MKVHQSQCFPRVAAGVVKRAWIRNEMKRRLDARSSATFDRQATAIQSQRSAFESAVTIVLPTRRASGYVQEMGQESCGGAHTYVPWHRLRVSDVWTCRQI